MADTVLQCSTLILSNCRGHSIDVSNNIQGYQCEFFLQGKHCLKITNFLDRFRQCFQVTFMFGNENHICNDFFRFIFFSFHQAFSNFEKQLFSDFLKLSKYYLRKTTPCSLLEVFCKKGVFRNFAKFTGKFLCQSLSFKKVAG